MTTPRRRKVWQHDTENISEDQIREYFHRLGWEVERFGKDYGEDLFIRIFEEGAFTGKGFYVFLLMKVSPGLPLFDHINETQVV